MKAFDTKDAKWQLNASAMVMKGQPFELLGFDLEIPSHQDFWNSVKDGGKFNCHCTPKVKAIFLPDA